MKVLSVVGARPNFMKIAPLHAALAARAECRSLIVHTGQHYDRRMSDIFFHQLGLPEPDVYLGVGSGSHAQQTARVMMEFEEVLIRENPDLVVVVGDVNSTVAASLVAAKLHIPVAHVEAGLRSGDRSMPEEINRLVTDSISDLLFVTEQSGIDNLRREGVPDQKVFLVGNVMIDSLVRFRQKAARTSIPADLNMEPRSYAMVTMHRPSNVDNPDDLAEIVNMLELVSEITPVVFPVHPRTRCAFERFDLLDRTLSLSDVRLLEPVGYLEFIRLMEQSLVLITDSGGIQEETTYLGVPCLTIRENTERPVTIAIGTNELMPLDARAVANRVSDIASGRYKTGSIPPLWDGRAAERIAEVLTSEGKWPMANGKWKMENWRQSLRPSHMATPST